MKVGSWTTERRRRLSYLLLGLPLVLTVGPLLLGPVLYNARSSLDEQTVGVETTGLWVWDNYGALLTDPFLLQAMVRTIALGLATVAVCIALGLPYAYFVNSRIALRELQLALVIAPLLVNMVVRVYGWQVLLSDTGLVNSFLTRLPYIDGPLPLLFNEFAVILSLVHVLIPYMILSIYTALQNIDRSLVDAARSLGAPKWRAITSVTLPLALPGIVIGSILVFTLSAGSFLVPAVMGGGRVSTLPTLIYQYSQVLNWPFAATLAIALMIITVPVIVTVQRFSLRGRAQGR